MEHESRSLDFRKQRSDIDQCALFEQSCCNFRRGRFAAQVVEPVHLFIGSLGNKSRREHLTKRRIVLTPTEARKFDDGAVDALRIRVVATQDTASITTVKDQ